MSDQTVHEQGHGCCTSVLRCSCKSHAREHQELVQDASLSAGIVCEWAHNELHLHLSCHLCVYLRTAAYRGWQSEIVLADVQRLSHASRPK